ncbi:hypothetical protein MACK_001044 [Theileria orientalis]|uniref:Uncharacterized protein n=1 Tax=Theileria orientalis TaxID=68886 RepID=A0A976MDX2_THEOR|nr:hypothetical protein MACK_001044 [Theileria orientalis]
MNLSKYLLYYLIYWLVSYRIKFTESTTFLRSPGGGGGLGTGGGSGVQLTSVDINSRASTNEVIYKHYQELNAEKYMCKPGYLINKVLINGNILKSYDGDYPNRAIILKDANGEPILRMLKPGDQDDDEPFDESDSSPTGAPGLQFTSVDINSRASTNEVIYKHYQALNAEKYLCKPGYLINKVLINGNILKSYDGDYPNRAIILKDANGEPILRMLKPGDQDDDEPFDESDSSPTGAPGLQFTSVDINSRASTNEVIYKHYQALNAEKYLCKPGYLINKVLINGNILKSYDGDYPNRAIILKDANGEPILRMLKPGDQDDDEPFDESDPPPSPAAPALGGTKFTTVDINVKQSTPTIDYFVYPEVNKERFVCKSGYLLSELLINGNSFRKFTENHPDRALILPDPSGEPTLRLLHPGEVDPDEPVETRFTSVDINVKQSTNTVEYFVYPDLNIERFVCLPGYLISDLLIKGNSFRKFTENHPDRLLILPDENGEPTLRILHPGEVDPDEPGVSNMTQVDINVKQSTNTIDYCVYPELNIERFVCKPGYLLSAILINGNVFRNFTEDYPDRVMILPDENGEPTLRLLHPGEYDPDEPVDEVPGDMSGLLAGITPGLPGGAPHGASLITIEVTNYQSTDQYDYRKYPNDIHKFLCKPGLFIQTVTFSGDPVWKYEKGDYPNRLLILKDPTGNPFMKLLAPHEVDPAEPVDETLPSVPTVPQLLPGVPTTPPITLNLDNLQDTNEVEYKYDPTLNIHTFKGKGSVIFKDATQGGTVVWKHEKGDFPNELRILTDSAGNPKLEFGFPSAKPTPPPLITSSSQPSQKTDTSAHPPDPNAKKTFELDLTEKESTNEYTYEKCGNIDRFTPKGNYVIRVVKQGESEVWRTIDPTNFSNKVEIDHFSDDNKMLVIYLLNYGRRVFKKSGKYLAWAPFDNNRVKGSILNVSSNSGSNFKMHSDGSFRTYVPKEGQEFIKVVENEIAIWEANDVIEYANKVELDSSSDNKVATIYSYQNKTRVYEKAVLNQPWKRIDITRPNPETVNINFSHNSFAFYNDVGNTLRRFTAKDGFAFDNVCEFVGGKNVIIWKTNSESEYATKVEVDTLTEGKIVTVFIPKKHPRIYEKVRDKTWTELNTSEPIPKQLNIKFNYETYSFTNKYDNDLRTFEAKEGFLFNGVREEKNNIWTTSKPHEFAYKVEYGRPEGAKIFVTIHMSNDYTKVYIKDNDTDPWTEVDTTKVNPRSLNIELDFDCYYFTTKLVNNIRKFIGRDGFEFYKVKEGETEIWKTENPDLYSFKVEVDLINNDSKAITIFQDKNRTKVFRKNGKSQPWTEIDTTLVNPRSVNINYPSDSYFFRNRVEGIVRTFTPRLGFIFKSANEFVNDQKVEFWTAMSDKDYANKVEVLDFLTDQMFEVTIHQSDRIRKYVKDSKTAWKELNLNDKNPVPANIMYTKESYKFYNRYDNGVRTLLAKPSFVFDRVQVNTLDLWKAQKPSEYATKIEYGEPQLSVPYVTIYLQDESTRLFTKEDAKKPWQEFDLSNVTPKSINIINEFSTFYYNNKVENNISKFIAKDGFEFYKVKEDNIDIWKTDNPDQYSYKVEVDLINNDSKAITIYQDKKTKVFRKNAAKQPWTEIDTTIINPRSVNINYPSDSYFFRNRVDNNGRTFSARNGFLFKSVNEFINDQKVEFWTAANDKEFANKVVIEGGRKVTIHLRDGVNKRNPLKGREEIKLFDNILSSEQSELDFEKF